MNNNSKSGAGTTASRMYLKFTAIFTMIFATIAYVFVPLLPTIVQDVFKGDSFFGMKSLLGIEFSDVKFSGEKEKSYVNVLLMGLDKDETRTDVMMVAQLNMVNNSVSILQIPRDTYVSGNGRSDKKINSAYGFGGATRSIKEVQSILDIEIDGYVTVTISGFRDVVDAVGGIYYDVPRDMNYEDPYQDLYIHLKKGYQLLDGREAEQYVRYRSGYTDGDLGRVNAQSDFIKEAIRQIIERSAKNDDAATAKLITSLSTMVETDFSLPEMLKYAPHILNVNMDNVNVMMIKGEPRYQNEVSYFFANDKANKVLVKEYMTPDISDADLSEINARDKAIGTQAVSYVTSDAPSIPGPRGDISVYIMDYSNTDGEKLKEYTEILKDAGFNVVGSVQSKTAFCDTTYCISKDETVPYSAETAKALGMDTYWINSMQDNGADVVIVIGKEA